MQASEPKQITIEGVPLYVLSETDARLEYEQLKLQNQVYFGPFTEGLIKLQPGDVVVDVGANVGSFARVAAAVVGQEGHVYAVEPIPQVYRALELNSKLDQESSTNSAPITPIHGGIVEDARARQADFVFYPRCAAFSTLLTHRDDTDALQATYSVVTNTQQGRQATSWLQGLAQRVARLVPHVYKPIHTHVSQWLLLSNAQTVTCPVATLSQIIDENKIERIDLLKINVERCELEVLRSVGPQHWIRIQQVSMQLHDLDTRLHTALDILHTWGLTHTLVRKEPRFKDCCLVQVYASRHPKAQDM